MKLDDFVGVGEGMVDIGLYRFALIYLTGSIQCSKGTANH